MARAEVAGAKLGDARLASRLERMSGSAAIHAGKSLPKQAGSVAALEATYRFLNNEAVTPEAILEPHLQATVARARDQGGVVLVAHDTTEFDFGDRKQLGELNGHRKGFFCHASLVVSADEGHAPLGVVAAENLFREQLRNRARGKKSSEGLRWQRGFDRATAAMKGIPCIHLMDREGDAYELMSHIATAADADFVIRARQDRVLGPGEFAYLSEALEKSVPLVGRSFPVGKRSLNPSPRHRKRHPPREEHLAKAVITSTSVQVRRPVAAKSGPAVLPLNVVRVRELLENGDPSAIEWILWTTLPVDTAEQVLAVVDAYRGRWRIEELFKSVKTGCQFERLQLESRRALTNALSVFLPVAWLLLHLRVLSRDPIAPARAVLSELQIVCLRAVYAKQENKALPAVLSARDVLLALARIGGHLKNNGEPGWLVLNRGLHDVLIAELGALAVAETAINP